MGKMIHVNAALDSMCWPGPSAFYSRKVRAHQGERTDDVYRLWWVDNAPHGAPEWLCPQVTPEKDPALWTSRLVDYNGVTAEALRELTAWVEDGVPPAPSTSYELTEDSGLVLAPAASARGGVQPIAEATANGGVRTEVKVGETVNFEGTARQPPGTGFIVSADWDFEGTGAYEPHPGISGLSEAERVTTSHAYAKPGTYFASFRVGGHRAGMRRTGPAARNLARVRIIVS